MPQKNLDFRHISASLRPPRFALAYGIFDNWIFDARRANAVLARVWGGAGDIVVPIDLGLGQTAPELLPFLRLFDPDYVGGHLRTVGDLGNDDGVKSEIITKHGYEGQSADETWNRLRLERLAREGNWDAFADQVDAWCSPIEAIDRSPQDSGCKTSTGRTATGNPGDAF